MMADQHPHTPPVPVNTADADASDPAAVRQVFRAGNPLAVSVMERSREYRVAYSLGDIHRLTFLSHDERGAVQREWHAWHRTYVRFGIPAAALWLAAALVTGLCWFGTGAVVGAMESWVGFTLHRGWVQGIGGAIALGLLWTLPAFLATIAASALCDAYLDGYSDGLTRGVNRALRITPEVEKEMWDELREAERIDARWRQQRGAHPCV